MNIEVIMNGNSDGENEPIYIRYSMIMENKETLRLQIYQMFAEILHSMVKNVKS